MITVPSLPVIAPLALIGLVGWLYRLHRDGRLDPYRFVSASLVTLYGAAVLAVTMFPMRLAFGDFADHAVWIRRLNLIPVSTIDAPSFNLNVAMMLPFGVLLPLLTPARSWPAAVRWGALVSVGIETTQLLFNVLFSAGRLADVNDVLANTIGTVFGYALFTIAAGTPGLDSVLRRSRLFAVPQPGVPDPLTGHRSRREFLGVD